ncbi:MAG: hypothetical protein QM756_15380 [Polyangiaceae bacterium]
MKLDERHPQHSPCIRCDTCDGFPCLVQAKADAETCGVVPALRHPNVEAAHPSARARLETSASGREISGVVLERRGEQLRFTADIVVVLPARSIQRRFCCARRTTKHPRASPTARMSSGATTWGTSTRS